MRTKRSLTALCALALFAASHAQTNPSAVSLPFSLATQTSATLPAGVAVHRFSTIPTTRTLAPANGGDLSNEGSSPALATGGWYNLGTDGIGILSSGTNPAGAVVVAINTTGLSSISVSWICKTIKNQASRDNSIALQYRVGTTGNFTDAGTTSTYASTGTADGNTSPVFTETLPAGANNQSVVQVRWIYWESVSTSGSRDKISVDNISITSATTAACPAPTGLTASGVTSTTANFNWGSVAGASSYEYALTTSPAAPGSGTSTAAISYSATGLTAGTTYYFYVRSICSATSSSAWTSTSVTTPTSVSGPDSSEITIMTYNLLNYPGSDAATREPYFRTTMTDVSPDILVVQELSSTDGPGDFLNNVMNFSSTDYSLGTFINGPDSDNGIYYKTSKFQFISNTPIHTDLRDISQFKLKYLPTNDVFIIYSAHLKADDTSPDAAQRANEIDSLRKVTDTLSAGAYFMVCGDFNIYGSTESAYQEMVTNGSNSNGKFNDLLSMTGIWNNSAYAINHTQSPRTTAFGGGATGGLDDRFDMILFSSAITTIGGLDVVSGSYKAYGNDGNHYNQALNTPNTMYTSTQTDALYFASDHLPVVVKLKYASSGSRTMATGIANNTINDNNVSIYPNPAHTAFFVKASRTLAGPVSFYLSDVSGRILKQAQMNDGAGETLRFDVSGLAPGIYYVGSKQLNVVHKIIVE